MNDGVYGVRTEYKHTFRLHGHPASVVDRDLKCPALYVYKFERGVYMRSGNRADAFGMHREKFYTVFCACGGDEKVALDRALSARVIPSAVVALNGVENTENKNLSERLEMIFGEENIEVSRSAVRAAGSSVL